MLISSLPANSGEEVANDETSAADRGRRTQLPVRLRHVRLRECAWVLWQEVPAGAKRWSLDEGMEIAFPTKAKCEKRLKARAQAFAQATTGPRPFLACLPDTVDPRGPKGK